MLGRASMYALSARGRCVHAAPQHKCHPSSCTMPLAAMLLARRCSSSHYHKRYWEQVRDADPLSPSNMHGNERIVSSLAGALGEEPPRLKSEMFGCVDSAPRKSDYTAYILWTIAALLIGADYVYSEYVDPTNWFNTPKNALAPGVDLAKCPVEAPAG